MTKKTENQELLFKFLKRQQDVFSAADMVEATHYKVSTVKTYIRKKFLGYLIEHADSKNKYKTTDKLKKLEQNDFLKHMSQISKKVSSSAR